MLTEEKMSILTVNNKKSWIFSKDMGTCYINVSFCQYTQDENDDRQKVILIDRQNKKTLIDRQNKIA
jgi:hypothetical protein